jgi:hypothetical protein
MTTWLVNPYVASVMTQYVSSYVALFCVSVVLIFRWSQGSLFKKQLSAIACTPEPNPPQQVY